MFVKNWMTKKGKTIVGRNTGTIAITIKHILTTKTFNQRDLTQNTNSNFRHRNDCNDFDKRFEKSHGRINNFQDKAPER